jgi:uncharacterized repeat protein (TIGR01451 family)
MGVAEESQPAARPGEPAPRPGKNSMAFPTGDRASSVLLVEKSIPEQVLAGQDFAYDIRVTNLTDATLHGVQVREVADAGMGGSESESAPPTRNSNASGRDATTPRADRTGTPAGDTASDTAGENSPRNAAERDRSATGGTEGQVYDVGTLGPRQSKTVRASGHAGNAGTMMLCTSVSYSPMLCSVTNVIAPKLEITKTGPATGSVGQDLAYSIRVTNTGVGPAENVVINDRMPEGMTSADPRATGTIQVGTLAAGQSREYAVKARASRTGRFCNTAEVTGANGLSARAEACTEIKQAKLTIEKTGPASGYTGIPADFQIKVTNAGDIAATNVVLEDAVPAGATVVSAEGIDNSRLASGRLAWNLGTLEPGASRTVGVQMKSAAPGRLDNCATARADGIAPVQDCAAIEIEGVTGLLIEITDQNDPIRIGGEEIYTIVVTNQGTADATNVRIDVELEQTEAFVSASGAEGNLGARASRMESNEGGHVRFGPLDRLSPNEKVGWRVVIRGTAAGDARFTARMTADQLDRPVEEQEATRIIDVNVPQTPAGGRPGTEPPATPTTPR